MNRFVICGLIWLATVNVSMAADNDVATSEAIHNLALGKKIEPAFSNTLENAETGDPNALIALGNVFAEGLYAVPQNDAEALRWYEKAAQAGNSTGEYLVGSCHEHGKGTAKNLEQALAWYKLSAGKGFASA